MNNRERILNILHYKDVDRFPAVHFGYWEELLQEWAEQGKIPKDLAVGNYDGSQKERELDYLIGWDCNWYKTVGFNYNLDPPFERKLLEVLPDGCRRILNEDGIIERVKPGTVSIPSEDDYLLKDREAFETLFKPKMQYSPNRINFDFFRNFSKTRPNDVTVGIHAGSVIGNVRNMTSVIGMSYLMYDEDEELFGDIIDTYADMQYKCLEAVLNTCEEFDFAHYWEDICFKNGPLISPKNF